MIVKNNRRVVAIGDSPLESGRLAQGLYRCKTKGDSDQAVHVLRINCYSCRFLTVDAAVGLISQSGDISMHVATLFASAFAMPSEAICSQATEEEAATGGRAC